MTAYISRDPFARETLEREVSDNYGHCYWCGNHRYHPKEHKRGLFQYITVPDGGRRSTHHGYFCSKSCHDAYHR